MIKMSSIKEYFPLEAMAAKHIMFLLKNTSVYFLKYTTTGANIQPIFLIPPYSVGKYCPRWETLALLFTQATALPVPLY